MLCTVVCACLVETSKRRTLKQKYTVRFCSPFSSFSFVPRVEDNICMVFFGALDREEESRAQPSVEESG